jgi:hypothetical protein
MREVSFAVKSADKPESATALPGTVAEQQEFSV